MAITATNILAAGTTALPSAAVVVDAGATAKLMAFPASGSALTEGMYGIVEEKNAAGNWFPVIYDGDPLVLGYDAARGLCSSVLMNGPGEYRVNRLALAAGVLGFGVDKVV